MEENAAYMKKLYEYGKQLNNSKDKSGSEFTLGRSWEKGANRNNFLRIGSNSTEVQETYSELNGKDFAYDGEKTLFTLGSLARNKLELTVVLEDVTRDRFKLMWLFVL
ncbi:hypothetical protein RJT34_12773 [Clitoria ternatea]|uniref:Uncharacterized protein n=1 Tax=Clitoria ternatea TaxID=43366 RepID=A0AAN9PKU4_CLITE